MINRCIGCYYHDCKENVCTHGSPIFIDDECTDYQDNDFIKQKKVEVIDLIDRHLWNYSHEVWEDFKPILEQLKEQNK